MADWREARFERLSQRVDRIEEERREEKRRTLDRWVYLMLVLCWMAAGAAVALAAVSAGSG
ncbi:MAG TPA: hypothetical protein VLL27_01280 [Solirubrobacterales bacterium]|nr:hypothetical protein [Solirubrobacterales bacterium]